MWGWRDEENVASERGLGNNAHNRLLTSFCTCMHLPGWVLSCKSWTAKRPVDKLCLFDNIVAFRQFSGFRFCSYLWNTSQIRKSETVLWITDDWLPFSCEFCQLTKSEAYLHFWHRTIVLKSSRHISCNSLSFRELIEVGGMFVCLFVHVCGVLPCLVLFIMLWHTSIWEKSLKYRRHASL